jgi:DNA invertase Pin-like site-specific DNA recombinase
VWTRTWTARSNELRCVRVFTEKLSGRDAERPELWKCLDYLRPGDTPVVLELSRLGRNLHDLLSIVAGLRKRGIGFRSVHEALDTTTPGGRLVFHVFAALAEFIRELIVQGTREGMAAARARGVRIGRPPAMTPEQIAHARDLLTQPKNTVASIARLLGVSRATIYKHVPELADSGAAVSTPRLAELATAEPITVPLLAERTVPDTLTCPSCGSVPNGANDVIAGRRSAAGRADLSGAGCRGSRGVCGARWCPDWSAGSVITAVMPRVRRCRRIARDE